MSNTTNNQKIIQLLKEYNNKFGLKLIKESHSEKHIKSLFRKNYNEDEIVKAPKQMGTDKKEGDTWLMLDVDNAKELFDEGFKLYLLYDLRKPFFDNYPFGISNFVLALEELEDDKNMRIGIHLDQFIKGIFRKLSKYDDVYNRLYDIVDGGELELAMTLVKSQDLLPIIENRDVQVINLLKEYNSKYELLTEASKLKILTDKNKWGMPEEQAKVLDDIFGSLSVWVAKKIGEYYSNILPENYPTPKDALSKLFLKGASFREQFNSIKDYIVVELDGKKSSLDNLNYKEIYDKSKEWHDSLNVGDGDFNYTEPNNHTIIIDFRENGEGYYWVALNTKNSEQECKRMGHCGRSSHGYLYSLRSDKNIRGEKYKANRSHLTSSIGTNGVLYQLKGPKNSKPKEEFHQYILPLFSYEDDGEYLISGFGTEYASQQDFKLEDLPIETLKELYQDRPELFKSRGLKNKMRELGIEIEVEPLPTAFEYEAEFDRITDIIDGDEVVGRGKEGRYSYNLYLSEVVLSKDFDFIYEKFETDFYSESWEDILENSVYEGLKSHIRRLLMMMVERDEENIKLIKNYENKDLIDFINEVDVNDDIKNALLDKYHDALLEPYIDDLYQSLIDTLKIYGDVRLTNSSVTINGDLSNFVDMDDSEVIDVYERVESEHDEIYCDFVFYELVSEGIVPKAEWRIPVPEDVDLDEDKFNDLLNDELNEIENRI